jgi:hypothetical protein
VRSEDSPRRARPRRIHELRRRELEERLERLIEQLFGLQQN